MALKTPARRGARAPRLQRDTCSGTPAETRTCGRAPGFAATARGSARPTSGGGAPGRPQARGRCGIKRFGRSARLGHACGPSPGQCPAAWGSGSHRLLARTFWGPTGCRARVPWDRGPWQPGGSRGDAQAGIPGQALVTLQGTVPSPLLRPPSSSAHAAQPAPWTSVTARGCLATAAGRGHTPARMLNGPVMHCACDEFRPSPKLLPPPPCPPPLAVLRMLVEPARPQAAPRMRARVRGCMGAGAGLLGSQCSRDRPRPPCSLK